MNDTMLTSLRRAREKLISDATDLQDRYAKSKDSLMKFHLTNQYFGICAKIDEIDEQIRTIMIKPIKQKTFWQKLFNR